MIRHVRIERRLRSNAAAFRWIVTEFARMRNVVRIHTRLAADADLKRAEAVIEDAQRWLHDLNAQVHAPIGDPGDVVLDRQLADWREAHDHLEPRVKQVFMRVQGARRAISALEASDVGLLGDYVRTWRKLMIEGQPALATHLARWSSGAVMDGPFTEKILALRDSALLWKLFTAVGLDLASAG